MVLKSGAFEGMTTSNARCPATSSTAWTDCLSTATNGGTNPIGKCLWFNGNDYYATRIKTVSGKEKYTFDGSTYTEVVEKVVIQDHTFFRLSGY
ncbi:hypothetical protein D3C73_1444500 [compost metagenome]